MKWSLFPKEQGPMGEYLTEIEVVDDGAGEFLVIRQPCAEKFLSMGGIALDHNEWQSLRDSIDAAFASMSDYHSLESQANESQANNCDKQD